MTFEIHHSPFEKDLLKHLAQDLQATLPGAQNNDFSKAKVILPSSRACQTLGHVLLESQSGNSILLPQAMTMTQIMEELAVTLGFSSTEYPDDLVRPGHIFPLRADVGGVLKRAGHTEAAVDLARSR